MKLRVLLIAALLFSLNTQAQVRQSRRPAQMRQATSAQAIGQTLPIRRVILYSNGVAYIERRGAVTGHAEIDLSFKQSQVDDVLKSMVVLDLGRGRIGAVSYNSSAPPSARMADIPFSIASESENNLQGGLAGVLSQLQGARVVVATTNRTATGSILTVEERKTQIDATKPAVITHALVIASENGELASFNLEDVRSIRLVDEGTRRDVSEFASATASARRRDAKTITVTSDGAGTREMVVSYTIAAPIWKTTYRVVLDQTGQPFFQGWAIVDNVSEEDWNDIQLSLVSGTPVSFIQPIQKPFYRYRPVIPMPEDLRLAPQVYEPDTGEVSGNSGRVMGSVIDVNGSVVPGANVIVKSEANGQQYSTTTDGGGNFRTPPLASGSYTVTVSSSGFKQYVLTGVRVSPVRPANIRIPLEVANVSETVTVMAQNEPLNGRNANTVNNLMMLRPGVAARDKDKTLAQEITGGDSGVETAAEGEEVGDLFEYQIAQPVTVKRDRSALIPILQTRMEGARVSIFNEATRRNRPMSGMLLKNTSALTLEDGSLTVIDGDAYAGESIMERLKPGEQRLVSFALDLGTLATVRAEDEEQSPAYMILIAGGTLYAHFYNREKKVYTLTNQTDKPRVVYVEHPVREDWELDDHATPKPEGKSARYYRFRVELAPRGSKQLMVVEREDSQETYALMNISPDTVQLFVSRRYIDDATRAALQNILDLRSQLTSADARIAAIDKEIREIGDDQKRLRENIEALTKTAEARQLIARYVSKADEQETRLEQLTKEKQAATMERQRLQSQLDAAIRGLDIKRELTKAE
ncbi:MAG: carboxypeptidase regulatory-like domain-containing protein [Acidobacteriota bacterium]|nr:carboxypeptidase regulatory-like domain-containing protein [Acidobacteriota bacterium]